MKIFKYRYMGSVVSQVFELEIKDIAEKVFHGEKVFYSSEQAMTEDRISPSNWDKFREYYPNIKSFGFEFGTNPTLIRWFNYVDKLKFSPEETKIVWEEFCKYPKIKDISDKIWNELEMLVKNGEGWHLIEDEIPGNPFDLSTYPR